jgi:hypothetical protein
MEKITLFYFENSNIKLSDTGFSNSCREAEAMVIFKKGMEFPLKIHPSF